MEQAELDRFLEGPLYERAATALAILMGYDPDKDPLQAVAVEDGIEAYFFIGALLIEANPHVQTQQQLRLSSEEVGRRILAYAKAIRAEAERTGNHPMKAFGVTEAVPHPDKPSN